MQSLGRRHASRLICGVFCGASLAGCVGDGGTGDGADDDGDDGDDGAGGDVPQRIHTHLQRAQGYDQTMADRRGNATVEIDVGAGSGGIAFAPAALRIDVGSRVVWTWTGRGGNHDVASIPESDMGFQSERTREAGHEFEQTFEEAGIALYECRPHRAQGMLGAIEVVEPEDTA